MRPTSRLLLALGLVLALWAPAQAAAHNRAHAARIAHLKARVAALAPSATAQVAAAKAQGPAAIAALVQKVIAMPLAAPGTTTPDAYAYLQALAPGIDAQNSAGSDVGLTASIASACWYVGSHLWNSTNYTDFGVQVGHAEKDHGYWCGNGSSITDAGGANWGYYHKVQASAPYCIVTVFNYNSWDAPHAAWAHGGLTTHFGIYTPWTSCVTNAGANDGIRINAAGGHDVYWDF
jgi:hypothetical protein